MDIVNFNNNIGVSEFVSLVEMDELPETLVPGWPDPTELIKDVPESATGFLFKESNGTVRAATAKEIREYNHIRGGKNKAEATSAIEDEDVNEARKKEYPPIGDQLDEIWKVLDGMSVSSAVLDSIKAVKVKYPKV